MDVLLGRRIKGNISSCSSLFMRLSYSQFSPRTNLWNQAAGPCIAIFRSRRHCDTPRTSPEHANRDHGEGPSCPTHTSPMRRGPTCQVAGEFVVSNCENNGPIRTEIYQRAGGALRESKLVAMGTSNLLPHSPYCDR